MVVDSRIISDNIAHLRLESGLKPKELAEKCGCTAGHINNIERGIGVTPTLDMLQTISEVLHCNLDILLQQNLVAYRQIEAKTQLDKELLSSFYALPVEKKECIVKIVQTYNEYKGNHDIDSPSVPLDLQTKLNVSSYLQEILMEVCDLSESQQKRILDILKPSVSAIKNLKDE